MMTLMMCLSFNSCSNNTNDAEQKQIKKYELKYNKINDYTPYETMEHFLKICNNANDSSPFKQYTPDMIESQCASFFRIKSEENLKFVIELLKHKKIINNNNYDFYELQKFIDNIKNDKQDKLDKLIIKSFELSIEYQKEYLTYNV